MAINDCLEKIIKSIGSLPPLPNIVTRVLEVAEDSGANADEIVELIQYDQASTANSLRLCNSCYFGLRSKVQSIRHAVVLIGTVNVVRIVIAECCRLETFSKELKGYGLGPGELWRHSVACAVISQILAKRLGYTDLHELFTAALLHDIGKLVIDSFIADNFEAMFQLMQEKEFDMIEAEKAYLGIDHAELGGLIATAWQFPEPLIDAIRHHHRLTPGDGTVEMLSLTALSNLLAHLFYDDPSGLRHQHITIGIEREILAAFKLSRSDIEEIEIEAAAEMKKTAELLKVPELTGAAI